jgi:hypothetical protein
MLEMLNHAPRFADWVARAYVTLLPNLRDPHFRLLQNSVLLDLTEPGS